MPRPRKDPTKPPVPRNRGIYKQWTDEEKATALTLLKANGNVYTATAKQLNLPVYVLYRWAHGEGISHAVSQMVSDTKEPTLDRLFENVIKVYLDLALDDKRMNQVTGPQLVDMIDKLTTKLMNLRGQSTQQSPIDGMSDDELLERIVRLARKYRGQPPTPAPAIEGGTETRTALGGPGGSEESAPLPGGTGGREAPVDPAPGQGREAVPPENGV